MLQYLHQVFDCMNVDTNVDCSRQKFIHETGLKFGCYFRNCRAMNGIINTLCNYKVFV